MSEIRMDVDLEHPPARIWRALTEEKLLSQWLDLPGFAPVSDAELTGTEGQRRLAVLWGTEDVHTRLIWELSPTPDGAQLTLRQSCVYGEWDDELRDQLRDAWEPVLHERLPATLDWLAFQEVDLSAAAPGGPAEPITEVLPFAIPRRRRGRIAAVSIIALGFLSAVVLVALLRPSDEEPAAAPATATPPSPSATAPTGVAAIGPGASPSARTASPSSPPTGRPSASRTERTPAAPPVAVLGARYATVSSRLFGYDGEVTVTNTGQAPAQDWTVTITVRSGATVTDASDAEFRQEGTTVTFTGAAVAAAGSVRFEFEVADANLGEKGPTGCAIDGKACSGQE